MSFRRIETTDNVYVQFVVSICPRNRRSGYSTNSRMDKIVSYALKFML